MRVADLTENLIKDRASLGLLIIRILIGLSMVLFHGYGKLAGGPELWERVGGSMGNFGISFVPIFWGFMAMSAEFFASIALILGVAFKPAAAILVVNMLVAATHHLVMPEGSQGAGLKGASHALEFLAIYLGLFFTGPGKYRLAWLWSRGERI